MQQVSTLCFGQLSEYRKIKLQAHANQLTNVQYSFIGYQILLTSINKLSILEL